MQDPEPEPLKPSAEPEPEDSQQDAADFVTRQILDKDAVFFGG